MGEKPAVSFYRRSAPRPFYKSVFDALALAALLALIVFALNLTGILAPDTGQFVAIDGDSLRRDGIDFRLHGIDAPELHQTCMDQAGKDYPCGREAQRALSRLIRGATLSCSTIDTDRYGRIVAACRNGGNDINAEMVRLGWAIAYRKHSQSYVDEEKEAHAASRGIWQGSFESPENWRTEHRESIVRGDLGE